MTLLAKGGGGQVGQAIKPGNTQTVSIGATSVQSTVFTDGTTIVDVSADVDCFIAVGSNPTAVAADTPVWAKTYRALRVETGDKIAVIQASAGGTLYLAEGL